MTPSDANLPARPDYVAITYINAPVERVWRAFTIPADQATFFGGKTEIGEVGEPWIRHATDRWPAITGIVLAKEPPRRLALTWGFDANPPPDRVEFLIDPVANGVTRVTIREYHSRCRARSDEARGDRARPGSLRTVAPGLGSAAVLQIAGGQATALGIKPGDTVKNKMFGNGG